MNTTNKPRLAPGKARAFCTLCGESFVYPKALSPRPVYCDLHDPAQIAPIDLSVYQNAVDHDLRTSDSPRFGINETSGIDSYSGIDLNVERQKQLFYESYDSLADQNYGPGPAGLGSRLLHNNFVEQLTPTGNQFKDSPKLLSAAEIRAQYLARINHAQCPQITPITLPSPKTGTQIGIWHIGDVHVGTDACTYQAFKDVLSYIENTPDQYACFQGDLVDFLTGVSVGVMAEQSMTVQDQLTLVADDLLPLAKKRKILFMIRGNHEDRLDKATKNIVDALQTMARSLDVQYLQTEGWTKIQCAGASYLSYNIHGFPSGGSPGSLLNKMENMLLRMPSADVITCGHNHKQGIVPLATEELDPRSLRPKLRTRYGIYTSTFHSYAGYGRDFGLTPGTLGCAKIDFDVRTGLLSPRIIPVVRQDTNYTAVLP